MRFHQTRRRQYLQASWKQSSKISNYFAQKPRISIKKLSKSIRKTYFCLLGSIFDKQAEIVLSEVPNQSTHSRK